MVWCWEYHQKRPSGLEENVLSQICNLINLQKRNQAVVSKLCWDLAHKKDYLYKKWIHTYYIKDGHLKNALFLSKRLG